MTAAARLRGTVDAALRGLGVVAALILLAMMALTFVDVVARYLLSAPLAGGSVITEILLVGVIFAGLPLATDRDEHITIDLCDRWVPAGLVTLHRRLAHLFCGAASAFLTWRMYLKAEFVATTGETTAALRIPAAAIIYPMCVLIGVMAAIFLAQALLPARRVEHG